MKPTGVPFNASWLVAASALLLPGAVLIAPHAGEAAFVMLALCGLGYLLADGWRAEGVGLLTGLSLGFYGVAFASALIHGGTSGELWNPGHLREFLAAPLIGVALTRARLPTSLLLLAARGGALAVFTVALYQFEAEQIRAHGAVNPLVFAPLALLLGFFSIIGFPRESAGTRLFSLAAFAAGCGASILALSRTAWALVPVLLVCLLLLWRHRGWLDRRVATGVSLLLLTLAALALQTPTVQQRIATTWDNYRAYTGAGAWNSSLGQRFVLWRSGLAAAARKPLGGWGLDQTQQAAAAWLPDDMKSAALRHNHLHNEYLNNLVAKGLPGLLSLLALLFAPLAVFLKQAARGEHFLLCGTGIMLCVGYAVSGLSNQAFGDDTMNIFYVFFLAATLPALAKPRAALATARRAST